LEEIREILKKPVPKPTAPPFETKTEEPISEPTETDKKVVGEWLYKKEITNDEYVLLVKAGIVLGSEKKYTLAEVRALIVKHKKD